MLIFINMKLDIQKIIEIPEGVQVEVKDNEVVVKADGKELKKVFGLGKVKIEKDKDLKVGCKKSTKRESKMIGTIAAHLKNMVQGVKEDFVYKLEIANVHFPMNVKVEGDKVHIKNFLGEKIDRVADIVEGVKVDVKGNEITISSHDKENAGQTAGNIEKATKVSGRDRRIFQDGIFITEKPGRGI